MRAKLFSSRTISAVLIAGLSMGNLGFGSLAQAQSPAGQKPLDNQSNVPQQVSPGPLQPQPSTQPTADDKQLPNAPSATTQPSTVVLGPDGKPIPATPASQAQTPGTSTTTQPLGTAAAEKATTAGGAASRPAGMAIAPAKQRQVRSFLIRLGLIAAGGVALGTVYALSKGSPSKPPGAVQ